MKILFVEEDAQLRAIAGRHVTHQDRGDELVTAHNLNSAIKELRAAKKNGQAFDMVIAGDHTVGAQHRDPLLLLKYMKTNFPLTAVAMYTSLDREPLVNKLRATPSARIPSQLVFSKPESLHTVIRRAKKIHTQILEARRPVKKAGTHAAATLAAN